MTKDESLFLHAQRRAWQRYGIDLSRDDYNAIGAMLTAALEDAVKQAPKWNKPLVFGPIDPVAYPSRTEMNDEQIKKVIEEIASNSRPVIEPAPPGMKGEDDA